ncbi:MAG TPA: hypothetical protein VGJ82_10805 [Thermoanaerobaculia bacterium]|jgi:hypothetical protein
MANDPVLSFDPLRILRQLRDDGVEFVLIGGIAGRIHGSPTVTNDLDICYRRTKANCERLAKTLRELGARLRDLPAGLRAPVDAGTIWQGHNFTFITDAGFFDCLASPEEGAPTGYDDLAHNAATLSIAGGPVLVTSLEDLIRMKQAAGRAKDRIEVEVLKAVLAASRES